MLGQEQVLQREQARVRAWGRLAQGQAPEPRRAQELAQV